MTETRPLRIIRLEASNIKRLKAIEIVPNGNVVKISGKNDSGKTSCLDSIAYALGGKDAICERPLRSGASRGHVILDLHDIKVVRKFTASSGTTLTVTSKDGTELKSPQAVLDALCSHIAFDPLMFTRLSAKDQLETLRKLVGLDFSKLDADSLKAYEERKLVNRELALAKGRLAVFPADPSAPAEEVSVSDVMKELEVVQAHNRGNDKLRAEWKAAEDVVNRRCDEIEAIDKEILQLRKQLEQREEQRLDVAKSFTLAQSAQKEIGERVAAIVHRDEQPIKDKMDQLDSLNGKVRSNRRHKEIVAEVEAAQKKADKLTAKIEDNNLSKQEQLEKAKFPLPGLSFDESGVLLNGVPFSQGSQARQLQAAVAIGLALNPKVRVILIRDASLLDDESMKLVEDLAEKHDAQIWLEVVQSKDPSAIVIEDGSIKE